MPVGFARRVSGASPGSSRMLTVLNICPIEGAGDSKSARVKADTTIALHCNKS
jgi:hypothetical protein